MNTGQLLASEIPEEVLLAVLSNFDKKDGENVIKAGVVVKGTILYY